MINKLTKLYKIDDLDKSPKLNKYAIPVIIFYMLILSDSIKEIINYRLRHILAQSMIYKHILAFLLLYFLVILVNPEYIENNFIRNIIYTILVYIWFLITTKVSVYILIILLILLLIIYTIDVNKTTFKHDKDKIYKYNRIQLILSYIVLGLSIIGFTSYLIKKKTQYKKNFKLNKFLLGVLR